MCLDFSRESPNTAEPFEFYISNESPLNVLPLCQLLLFSDILHIFTEKNWHMWSFLELMMLIAMFPYQLADQGLGFIISTETYGREWEREGGCFLGINFV